MEVGRRIAYYRKKASLTQEDLADLMNVSRQTIYKWEHSLAYPEFRKLEQLTKILKITFDELLKQEEIKQ